MSNNSSSYFGSAGGGGGGYNRSRRNDRSIDSLSFADSPPPSRSSYSQPGYTGGTNTTTGGYGGNTNAKKARECTTSNWGAEIDRRYLSNTSSRDFAYDKSDPKHTSSYLLPEKKR